ncbi:MAG: 3-dehydro-L-gulonate 2-dehydrogenase [Sphaerochaetaceae bacterium]|nr:3-dehydro-L-gulonate 2-dehydrogenase [Spirochaetales bacterium]MDY5500693.1 3-dehydro-L-gulonate 2-dehydrogenase [Sphaerochaetaceae bacterium]
MRVPYETMTREFERVLNKYGITGEEAKLSARLYADASADGVATHGLNRFPKFIKSIQQGAVDVTKRAVKVASFGSMERWDGQRGPGNLNAWICTQRCIELAKEHGVGVVALRGNNHWMRPGNYGIEITRHDCIGLLWTNTTPNMPAWGGKDAKLGNNPMVVAVPYRDSPVIVDVAMSMFSYGKLEKYKREGLQCPVDGGIDKDGNITRDPAKILETHQVLPIGYWKGSGLSLTLDLIAATLSGGNTTRAVGEFPYETGLSQFFLAFDLSQFPDREERERQIGLTLEDLQASVPVSEGGKVHYPGQGMKAKREESMRLGVPVDDGIWQTVLEM